MDHLTSQAAASSEVRTIAGGQIRGTRDGSVLRFLSVPYAAPPVDQNRFKEPRPVEAWSGIRDATVAGPCAPHRIRDFPAIDVVPLVGAGGLEGGDYLTLNIWAPVVGVPLPLVSFGGSAVMTVMLCLGLLMALERQQRTVSRLA